MQQDDRTGFAARLSAIRQAMDESAKTAGRDAGEVTLVAVSKMQPDAAVEAAIDAGLRIFGENRVQEARRRWADPAPGRPGPRLETVAGLSLRLIGPLQTNKARDAVALFDVIETLDRPRLADALADAMVKTGRRPDCLIQVNTGEEPQKAGVAPNAVDAMVRHAVEACGLPVRGFMCIPPVDEPPALHFALLADIARRHGLPVLSMGMSEDFETAIRYGATHVRVGSALFGPRPAQTPAAERGTATAGRSLE